MTTVIGTGTNPGEFGVFGESQESEGVRGVGHKGAGVSGHSDKWIGVYGESKESEGVRGVGHKGAGVSGHSDKWIGTYGESQDFEGVRGVSRSSHGGVVGINDWSSADSPGAGGNGGWFESSRGEGVRGTAKSSHHGGVVGVNTGGGIAVYATSDEGVGIHAKGGKLAGFFDGDVEVTGDIRLINADCAEDFNVSGTDVEPGTVMVLSDEGTVCQSERAYDKRVAGVVSGAGGYKPGIVLDKQQTQNNRQPIALMGKVYCKVDAQYGAVEMGDLLTTSPTPGFAMAAKDPFKAFGAVIGKALRPLNEGQAMIPILVALQ
ncbi:MAG: hypothetical protein WAM60_22945 [Candidatus Promineifilaceae bacterium]